MPFLEHLRKIDDYIARIDSLNRDMERSGNITRLQTDLVREYLRDLYELYADLGKEEPAASVAAPPVPVVVKEPEPPAQAEASVSAAEPAAAAEIPVEDEVPEAEARPAEAQVGSAVDAGPAGEAIAEHAAAKGSAEQDTPVSLLEKFQKQSEATRKELNRRQALGKQLRQIIPLNEKIMMTREFFGNNVSAYESALSALDNLQSRKEVLDYMQQHVWTDIVVENHRELIDRFIALIDLKFEEGS